MTPPPAADYSEHASSVKLAFNACLASAPPLAAPERSRLLQAGLPAVIAMQAEIRDDAAIHFANSSTKS